MTNGTETNSCRQTCWIIAAILGVVLAALLKFMGDWGFLQAVFAGIVAAVILGFLLPRFFCSDETAHSSSSAGVMGAAAAGAGAAAISGAGSGSSTTAGAQVSTTGAGGASGDATSANVAASASADTATGDAGATAAAASAATGATTVSKAFEMQPTKLLSGEAELASRKGNWKYEAVSTDDGVTAKKSTAKKAPAKKAPAKTATSKTGGDAKSTAAKASAGKGATAKSATAKSTKAKSATAKTTAAKSGASKGTGTKAAASKTTAKTGASKATAAKSTAAKSTPAKASTAKAKRAPVAADGKPALMKKARAGGADDLKLISGVGPKLEGTLNEMGFWHFDQVAGWRKKEVEWVDQRLKFKGRIERDDWISQAKILAKGGETEFSKRSKKK